MAILGLLLLAAATVAGVEMTIGNRIGDVGFEVFGYGLAATPATVFLLGALTMAVAALGAFLITGAFQRRRAVRRDARHAVRYEDTQQRLGTVERTNEELVAENDRLRAALADRDRAAATMGGVAVPPGAGTVAYGDQVSDAVRSDTIADTGRFDPYPTEGGTVSGAAVNTEADRFERDGYDGDRTDDKAGILGRFRGTH
jgi:hypothetical protein